MSGYQPFPSQPFHKDLNPDLQHLVDDFIAEIDRLLREVPYERTPRHHA